ncbi:hypothetical protein GCN74_26135 [Janthinobacterium sp. FT14W]|nr:hypothetical protein GCN74_26135 [Janthinobacterium sp. FT14W]
MKWLLILLLAGCVSVPPAPLRVVIPVFTPCVNSAPQRPQYEFDKLAPSATDGEIILALARDWARSRIYELTMEAAIKGCS